MNQFWPSKSLHAEFSGLDRRKYSIAEFDKAVVLWVYCIFYVCLASSNFQAECYRNKKIICVLCLNFPFITFMSNCSVWTLCRWNLCMKRLPISVYFYEVADSTCSDGRSNSGMRKLRAEFTLQFLLQPRLLAWTTRAGKYKGRRVTESEWGEEEPGGTGFVSYQADL